MANFDFIKKDIIWTASDYSPTEAENYLPYIELVEYYQTAANIEATVNNWVQRLNGATAYTGLYIATPTNNVYRLPYFMDLHHQIGQNWQENQAPLGSTIQKLFEAAEAVSKTLYPAAGILYPKAYAGANEYYYDVRFSLLNTVDEVGIGKNKSFIEQFITQNLHTVQTYFNITPPCLYQAYIPGVRYSPICIVSNLSITNRGTLNRNVGSFGNYAIPDAWDVNIQFRELINEDSNIFKTMTGQQAAASTGGQSLPPTSIQANQQTNTNNTINGIPANVQIITSDRPLQPAGEAIGQGLSNTIDRWTQ